MLLPTILARGVFLGVLAGRVGGPDVARGGAGI